MEFRTLGRTGVQVSVACFGTMTFGWDPSETGNTEPESLAIYAKARELGINFFDTANVYGRGTSEGILGRAIAGHRDELVIATKCHGKMDDVDPNAWGNSRRHIVQACEASLKRLGTDWIDLYQIHRPQPSIPIDETLRGIEDLIRAGKILYAGTSTFAGWQLCEAHYVAREIGVSGFSTEQPPYNLLDRRIERDLLPFCRSYEYGVIPWSPLAGGQLSGKYLDGEVKGVRFAVSDPFKRVAPSSHAAVRELKALAEANDMTIAQMSLAWIASRPGITSPIIGARSIAQLEENVKGLATKLTDEIVAKIDEIVPPGTHVSNYYNASFGPNSRPR